MRRKVLSDSVSSRLSVSSAHVRCDRRAALPARCRAGGVGPVWAVYAPSPGLAQCALCSYYNVEQNQHNGRRLKCAPTFFL